MSQPYWKDKPRLDFVRPSMIKLPKAPSSSAHAHHNSHHQRHHSNTAEVQWKFCPTCGKPKDDKKSDANPSPQPSQNVPNVESEFQSPPSTPIEKHHIHRVESHDYGDEELAAAEAHLEMEKLSSKVKKLETVLQLYERSLLETLGTVLTDIFTGKKEVVELVSFYPLFSTDSGRRNFIKELEKFTRNVRSMCKFRSFHFPFNTFVVSRLIILNWIAKISHKSRSCLKKS